MNKRKRSRKYFDELVYENIKKMYPHISINKEDHGVFDNNVEHFDAIFGELWKIHQNKERYDLHWALLYANKKFHTALHHILNKQIRPRILRLQKKMHQQAFFYEEKKTTQLIQKLQSINRYKEKVFKKKAKFFGIVAQFVSIIDIIISVVLILIISEIAHVLGTRIDSTILGILLVSIVAGCKVTLDRFRIIPKIHKLGRSLYIKTITKFKKILAQYEAMLIVLGHTEQKNASSQTIVLLFETGITYIKKSKTGKFEKLF